MLRDYEFTISPSPGSKPTSDPWDFSWSFLFQSCRADHEGDESHQEQQEEVMCVQQWCSWTRRSAPQVLIHRVGQAVLLRTEAQFSPCLLDFKGVTDSNVSHLREMQRSDVRSAEQAQPRQRWDDSTDVSVILHQTYRSHPFTCCTHQTHKLSKQNWSALNCAACALVYFKS